MPRIAFSILQLALVAGIIMAGLAIFEKFKAPAEIKPAATAASDQAKAVARRQQQTKPLSQYKIIARRNLFRTPKGEKLDQAAIDIEALKPTELKLKLWGTITGQDGMTRAVIEDQSKRKQEFYRAGDDVSSAKVKMVLREKVILSVQGEDQILEIEKPASTAGRAPAARAPRGGSSSGASRAAAPPSKAPRKRTIRMKLSRLESISDNPEEWSGYATAAPYSGDDGESGLQLSRITPSSPLRLIGMRNGDVIMAVNDEPVAAIDDLLKSLTEVSAGDEMSLKIKRRGRERNLDFKFE
jgi:general secretion pathway protein C